MIQIDNILSHIAYHIETKLYTSFNVRRIRLVYLTLFVVKHRLRIFFIICIKR